jgi:site-specific recombinase XerD
VGDLPQMRWRDPASSAQGRHHIDPTVVQRAVREALGAARVSKAASCHRFRHAIDMHLLECGKDIRTIQELLGQKDVSTTMSFTHVLSRGQLGLSSPSDLL